MSVWPPSAIRSAAYRCLAVHGALAQPDARVLVGSGTAEQLDLHLVGALLHLRGERVVEHHRHNPEQARDQERRHEEAPDGHAGSPRDDQLQLACQIDKGGHGPEQDRERKDLLGYRGNAQEGHQRHEARTRAGAHRQHVAAAR